MGCYTSFAEKYTNIAAGGNVDAALWQALTTWGVLQAWRDLGTLCPGGSHADTLISIQSLTDITAEAL
jgi:hypothetical protein